MKARRAATDDAIRVLLLQHIVTEGPGCLGELMRAEGVRCETVALDLGEPIPDLAAYDALLVLAGPMEVWHEARHPWLAAEKAAIRAAVLEHRLPCLGVSFGHQLLADALGGRVARMARPEVGVGDIELTVAAARDPLFARMPRRPRVLHWHGSEVLEPPPESTVLARSDACAVQAMRVGPAAWGLQCHVHVTPATVPGRSRVLAYRRALREHLESADVERLKRQAALHMAALHAPARRLHRDFLRVVRGVRAARRPGRAPG